MDIFIDIEDALDFAKRIYIETFTKEGKPPAPPVALYIAKYSDEVFEHWSANYADDGTSEERYEPFKKWSEGESMLRTYNDGIIDLSSWDYGTLNLDDVVTDTDDMRKDAGINLGDFDSVSRSKFESSCGEL